MSAPPASFDYSNLRLRALSAAILIPVVLLAVWIGGWLFLVLMLGATCLLAREWATMAARRAPVRAAIPIAAAVAVALIAAKMGHIKLAWILVPVGAGVAAMVAMLRGLAERPADEAFGVIGAPSVAMVWLHSGPEGRGWVAALFAVAWAADSAAFGGGALLKGPKLWPRVSPKKTWSGFVVGLIAGVTAAVLVAWWRPLHGLGGPHLTWAVPIGFVAALAVMAGDLWESMLKRRFGVKDSGQLIPGHGGLLDRVDGLMFAAVAMAAARLLVEVGVK